MKNLLSEEIERMLYLTGHKRGVVISEQNPGELKGSRKKKGLLKRIFNKEEDYSAPNARGKDHGDAKINTTDIYIAKNIGYNGEKFYLGFLRQASKNLGYSLPGKPPKDPTIIPPIPGLYQSEQKLPYPDNFINPQWSLFPQSKTEFDNWVNTVADLIKKTGGLEDGKIKLLEGRNDKNKPIKINGTANSVPPTTDVPKEMLDLGITTIDHDYGGAKDKAKMNSYLADQRARMYGSQLAQSLSTKTGIPAEKFEQYMDYTSYSYYGSGTRGTKSISVSVDGFLPGKELYIPGEPGEEGKFIPPQEKNVQLDFTPWGGSIVNGKTLFDEKGNSFLALPKETYDDLKSKKVVLDYEGKGTFNGKTDVSFKIKDDKIYLDDLYFGELVDTNDTKTIGALDPFARYVSSPGFYTGVPSVDIEGGYVIIYPIYLTLNKLIAK